MPRHGPESLVEMTVASSCFPQMVKLVLRVAPCLGRSRTFCWWDVRLVADDVVLSARSDSDVQLAAKCEEVVVGVDRRPRFSAAKQWIPSLRVGIDLLARVTD